MLELFDLLLYTFVIYAIGYVIGFTKRDNKYNG